MPGRVREEERWDMLSANFYRLTSPQTPHCPAALGCAQRARVHGQAPADLPFGLLLASREFLQSHIATAGPPQRESGVGAAPAPEGAGAPALHSLTGSCCSRRHRAVLPSFSDRLPVTSQALRLARPRAASPTGGCLIATEGQRPRLLELSCQTPANHLLPNLHMCCHWVMQINIRDNLTSAPGTRLRSGRGRSWAEASLRCGGGAGIGEGRAGARWLFPRPGPSGQKVFAVKGSEWEGGVLPILGWSRLPSLFCSWCAIFDLCLVHFVFTGCY